MDSCKYARGVEAQSATDTLTVRKIPVYSFDKLDSLDYIMEGAEFL